MIPRRDGVGGSSPCLPGWETQRLRQRLVIPTISECDSGSEAVERLTGLPEVLPQDCCRGRALTPWGMSCLVWSRGSVFQWEFEEPLSDPRRRQWLDHRIPSNDAGAQKWVDQWVGQWAEGIKNPVRRVSVSVSGTPFQLAVWRALLGVPRGSLTSYGRLAMAIGAPGAARAVGAACGANRVALLIPCHRVIRESGELSGYRWGMDRKVGLLAEELGRQEPR
jgi:AraC family transcriptional regulator of adaptative response/methylated-DNA-[protein]-cysteine methyltransferase